MPQHTHSALYTDARRREYELRAAPAPAPRTQACRPGERTLHDEEHPEVVVAINEPSRDTAVALYAPAVISAVPVSSAEVGEASKLLENIFRSANIAVANEMKIILDRMDTDVWLRGILGSLRGCVLS